MVKILLVGIGGFTGAVLRYALNSYIHKSTYSWGFPVGTLAVNVTGCIIIGVLSRWDELKNIFSPELRLLVFMGVLGAFTTFSTFGNETVQLLNDRKLDFAILNVTTHLCLGLFAVLTGRYMVNFFWK
ncbi:Protein CrcB homolog 1 [Desulfamplus magnetovallimortis]|uniref:Fluoride-specific ion channel FluC n=1 Tax=Desulfamplus magnetovallimortis TaxID=1246637 RepID=A0A1W1HBF4_9BACT|nr:fluoride efflux transporter CrcB [Desulfamplus magnetovallimortis]SLM29824.1 Protein CrcB homolog 1 [Desulfamplus magnetovallimortis]